MDNKPIRIQRKRTKGWKMPENTVCVDRSTKYGNPYAVMPIGDDCYNVIYKVDGLGLLIAFALSKEMATDLAIKRYEEGISEDFKKLIKEYLKGKNLACFCPLDQKCHADVLLRIANE